MFCPTLAKHPLLGAPNDFPTDPSFGRSDSISNDRPSGRYGDQSIQAHTQPAGNLSLISALGSMSSGNADLLPLSSAQTGWQDLSPEMLFNAITYVLHAWENNLPINAGNLPAMTLEYFRHAAGRAAPIPQRTNPRFTDMSINALMQNIVIVNHRICLAEQLLPERISSQHETVADSFRTAPEWQDLVAESSALRAELHVRSRFMAPFDTAEAAEIQADENSYLGLSDENDRLYQACERRFTELAQTRGYCSLVLPLGAAKKWMKVLQGNGINDLRAKLKEPDGWKTVCGHVKRNMDGGLVSSDSYLVSGWKKFVIWLATGDLPPPYFGRPRRIEPYDLIPQYQQQYQDYLDMGWNDPNNDIRDFLLFAQYQIAPLDYQPFARLRLEECGKHPNDWQEFLSCLNNYCRKLPDRRAEEIKHYVLAFQDIIASKAHVRT